MSDDPNLPQWMVSRLKFVSKRNECGPTHSACRCFIEKIIELEAEVAELRMQRYERVIDLLSKGQDAIMRVFGNSMLPLIKSKSVLTFRRTNDYQIGDVVMARVKGRIIDAHKITKVDGNGRFMISNNKGHDNGWASEVIGRVIAVNGKPFGRPAEA